MLKPFAPGNPDGGRPRGSRNLFNRAMINDLHAEWLEHGRDAIRLMRIENPESFVKACLSTLPRELLLETSTIAEMREDEIDALIDQFRRQLAASEEKPLPMIEAKNAEPVDAE